MYGPNRPPGMNGMRYTPWLTRSNRPRRAICATELSRSRRGRPWSPSRIAYMRDTAVVQIPQPPGAQQLQSLTPWATHLRYEDPPESIGLDRRATVTLVDDVAAWASALVPRMPTLS